MEKLYTVSKNKTRSFGSDHEHLIAKFRLKLKKVGKSKSEVAQFCPTLCDPMDCSPPGSSAHRILQARILE